MSIIQIIWFFLPAAIANGSGTLFRKINFLNVPVDFNKKINGEPIFGKNKTYRGFFFGVLLAIVFIYIQKIIYPYTHQISLVDYSEINFIVLGFLLGFGALFGDLVKSFVKRRLKIKPGDPFIPFDQIDWIVFANLFVFLYIKFSWKIVLISLLLFGIFHPISNIIAYHAKIKDTKY